MDKLKAMQTFVRIVDEGSLTAAARALDSSLPSVVRTLAGLEEELRVRLLNRTTRRLSLTAEGRIYLDRCRGILSEVSDAESELVSGEADARGKLSVTAPVLLGQMHVAPALRGFVQRHPHVQASLSLADRTVNLLEEHVDVGVRIGPLADSSLIAQQVASVRRVVVASPSFLRKHGRPASPKDLLDANCVLFGRAWSFLNGSRRFIVPVRGNLEFSHGAPAIEACVNGAGFGMFLLYQVAPHVARGRLQVVLEQFETEAQPLNIVYPHARLQPVRTRLFIEWMKSELGERLVSPSQVPTHRRLVAPP